MQTDSTFNALKTIFKVGWIVKVQGPRLRKKLERELEPVLRPHGYVLSPENVKRIEFYLYQSGLTNEWFTTLRGKPASEVEVDTSIYVGAFTPIMDDLMDERGLRFEELLTLSDSDSGDAVSFRYLLGKLDAIRSEQPHFDEYFQKAHLAQNSSLAQLGEEKLSFDQIEQITFNKGGYYTLFYRCLLQNELVEGEAEMVYTLGSILQMCNDIMDTYKDYHNGVQTMVNVLPDYPLLRKRLFEREELFRAQLSALDYPKANKAKAYRSMMGIIVMGHIALDQFEALQGKSDRLDIAAFSRKQLIVDHDGWAGFTRIVKQLKRVGRLYSK